MSACIAALAVACATTPTASEPRSPAIDPLQASPQLEHTQTIDLRLPVDGTWVVSQGYHGSESHHGRAAYALDLVKLDDNGQAYVRSGKRSSDWYGFGAEVLASADGIVVRATDRFPDNRVWGKGKDTNSIIVQHDDVFSEYVHLQRGSLRVRVGDRVTRGQLLARCGSSGAETPHLHWALLSSIDPIRTRPATFAHYDTRAATGEWHATTGIPKHGELIRPPLQ